MCRFFGYVGDSGEELSSAYRALKKAAEYDINLKNLSGRTDHPDGWGYVILSDSGIHHYRSGMPIYKDEFTMPKTSGRIYAIMHARRASSRSHLGVQFAHPFAATSGRSISFLAQNGNVRHGIRGRSGIEELFFDHIMRYGLSESVPYLEGITKSALNLIMLDYDRRSRRASLRYLNYYVDRDNGKRSGYYDMYSSRTKRGRAVFSSTLLGHWRSGKKVRFGKLQELKI